MSRRGGKKRDRYWLLYHVEQRGGEAEVLVFCTQSLRGLHASVATDAGTTSHVVASALGHSSPAVTHAHYIDGATARRARTRRVIGKVAPDPVLRVVENTPDAAKATRRRSRRAGQKKQIPAPHVVAGASSEPTGSLDPAVTGNDRSVTGKPRRLSTFWTGPSSLDDLWCEWPTRTGTVLPTGT
jgi:hypothetical protein